MNETLNEKKALALLSKELPQLRRQGLKATPTAADICATYKKAKPVIEAAIFIVQMIPLYGKKIADVIHLLEDIVDTVCR